MTFGRFVSVGLTCVALVACGDDDTPPPSEDASTLCSANSDCDDGQFCTGMERCDPDSDSADAMGCVSAANPPCDEGTCDEDADECTSGCADMDGDGAEDEACGGDDCDDSDPERYPGNTEVCDMDHRDEDCDPTTFGTRDIDLDGYVDRSCCNGDNCGDDCDETRRGTNPNVPEVCDGRDNDCDGEVDEDLLQASFEDNDRDLHGDPDSPIMACPGQAGASQSMLDCDDDNTTINSPQQELIDGEDNDCDGDIDEEPADAVWYPDTDNDGYGDPAGQTVTSNMPVAGHAILPIDCDDSDAAISPRATELCNGIDDNCDGQRDFVIDTNDWEDDDNDGYPDATCAGTSLRADCDDTDPITYPMAEERCDFRDNDCDGTVDEDCSGGCEGNAECDDGSFCNGVETCQSGTCIPGAPPSCGVMRCDDDAGMCVPTGGGDTDAGTGRDAGGPTFDAGGGGRTCSGLDLGGSPTGGGTLVGTLHGEDFFPADAYASITEGAGEGGAATTVEINLTDYVDACELYENSYLAEGRSILRIRITTVSADGPPGPPRPGTYAFGDPNENIGTPTFTGAFVLTEDGDTTECGYAAGAAQPDTPTGMITLTESDDSRVAGTFQYTGFGLDISGTFAADVCQGDTMLEPCCIEATVPPPLCDPIAQTICAGPVSACYPDASGMSTMCVEAGTGPIGSLCSNSWDCAPTLVCDRFGGYCRPLCYVDDDGLDECTFGSPPAGLNCLAVTGVPIGVCACAGVEVCGAGGDEDCDGIMDEGC